MRPSNKKIGAFVAGVMALGLVTGSWTFYRAENSIDNTMKTKSYGDVFRESFTPEADWKPGEETVKEAGVSNTGDNDLVVRVKIEETWARPATPDSPFISLNAGSTGFYPDTVDNGAQTVVNDGLTTGDGSVVYKNTSFGNWVQDGEWYYYKDVLGGGQSTGNFLNSITLCADTDMGLAANASYYTTNAALKDVVPVDDNSDDDNTSVDPDDHATSWIKLEAGQTHPNDVGQVYLYSSSGISSATPGYSGAQYVLTITAQTCAAEEAAVTAAWGAGAFSLDTNWNF